MKKLEALTKGYEGGVHTRSATSTHGVPRERKQNNTTQDTSFLIQKLKSSLGDSHRRSKENKEMSKTEMQKEGVCLVSLESKAKDAQREDVGDVLTHHKEEKPAPTHSTQVLVEKEHEAKLVVCSSIYLSPLELSINKMLQQPRRLKMDNFLSSFEGEMCWDSSKGKARGGPSVVPYSSASNLTSCTGFDLCFETDILEGITCHKTAPHFHFYMLMSLQVSLVHLGAIPYMLNKKSKHMNANMPKLFWNNELNHFEKFRGLKSISWVLLRLIYGLSISEIFILIHSRWKLIFESEMNQFKTCCPILESMCLGLNIVQIHCESLLELFGTSSARSLHGFEGVITHLVMILLRLRHQNSSGPLVALVKSSSVHNSHLNLNFNVHLLHKLPHYLLEVRVKHKPPWLLIDMRVLGLGACIHILKDDHFELCSKGNEAAQIGNHSYDQIWLHCPIKIFDPGGTSNTWVGEQSEFGNGVTHLLPFTILVYDPGRRSREITSPELCLVFDKWDTILGNESLHFDPTEFEGKLF